MPFVRVDYMKGQYTKEQLGSISKTIQSVLIEQFNVPSKDYFQIYQKHEDFEFYYDPEYFNVARTDKLLYIYVTLAPGRSQLKKLEFYQKLSCLLSTTCSIRQEDVFIMLVESERENWSFGNGLAQAFELNNGGVQ
ncbi:phenylpyruvate tautomerase PptA (4-oxalocrotonate tautomerase family) [Paenibacillus turicensis]|uniref:Phenylpyruvate tautomerase PptA (4-oxalocrotonate tautomerase family) n=1 Tax=Paenibacillus turicensis TaxID=160487 RepID=A0ABS4FQ54_9BACL|nr:tautomerase family protein [Paenibacillus turicensis]MBP1904681.1 phenylpyruvate tautomerase PptA (4-oxalocrotonate tautomerase family) [Paenibacillus turicensis]